MAYKEQLMAKTILIVEDDEDIRNNLQLLLESEGYAVELAQNGQVGIDFLRSGKPLPSLIVLDLMMPIMDGFQFREAQLKDPRIADVPVIVMTADGHVEDKQRRTAAKLLLRKPVDIDVILDAVARFSN